MLRSNEKQIFGDQGSNRTAYGRGTIGFPCGAKRRIATAFDADAAPEGS